MSKNALLAAVLDVWSQGVAGLHEVEQHLQLAPAVASAAAGLLGADNPAACGFEQAAASEDLEESIRWALLSRACDPLG
jgi:hypothetical protein